MQKTANTSIGGLLWSLTTIFQAQLNR